MYYETADSATDLCENAETDISLKPAPAFYLSTFFIKTRGSYLYSSNHQNGQATALIVF